MKKFSWSLKKLRYFFVFGFLSQSFLINAQQNLSTSANESDSLGAPSGEFVKKFYVLPIISASPETSLRLGAVGVALFRKKGVSPETQLSSIRVPISYTLNSQIRARINTNYYSNANRHLLKANIEWFNYPLLFYGVGNDTREENEEIYTTQTLIFNATYLKSIFPQFYLGIGYNYFQSKIIETIQGGMLEQPGLIPGNTGSITSGFNLNIRYDTRDNALCALNGIYVDVILRNYEPWMGSEYDFTRLDMDIRKYIPVFGKHLLALQGVYSRVWGNPSFETMSLLGGGNIMRGHYEGRYRDNVLYSFQAEYRMPLFRSTWIDEREKVPFKERWGLVVFGGLGDVASSFTNIELAKVKTSFGMGIRYLVLPKERINIRIDFGFGTQVPGFYFNIREAF